MRLFSDEEACAQFVIAARWPEGFRCQRCAGNRSYVRKNQRELECAKCGYIGSVTAGTVMHGTRKPLSTWLLAAWLLVTDKRGVSSHQLERQLGLRHETAFQMLHKLRAAMVAPDRELLRGTNVIEGATIVTDDLSHYRDMPLAGYQRCVESTAHGMAHDDVLTHYHLVISNLKAWLAGTHHGRVEPKHLQAYLNEYAFRFNRRRNLPAAFARLLGIGTQIRGPTYHQLYTDDGEPGGWAHPASTGSEAEEDLPW